MKQKGLLIALEGIDGSGTTTHAKELVSFMTNRLGPTHFTFEPSQGPIGGMLRQVLQHRIEHPLSDDVIALLFAADRIDHFTVEILPRLIRGEHVVTDRYVYSSLAYQSTTLPLEWVTTINERVPPPDLAIYLRVSPDVAASRRSQRSGPEELFDKDATQRRVTDLYDLLLGDNNSCGTCALTKDQSSWQINPIGTLPTPPNTFSKTHHRAIINGDLPLLEVQSQLQTLIEKFAQFIKG